MALPMSEPRVGHVLSVSIECADCGHSRWVKPQQLYRYGITDSTPLSDLGKRLSCYPCRLDGLPGKSISITAAFIDAETKEMAERWATRSLEARVSGSHAKRA